MPAAVKVLNGLDPEYDSLVAELNLEHSIYSCLAALGGSVIPKLFGFPYCPDVDSRVLITEFVDGAYLNPLTASKKVKLQALRGLEAIHSFGVRHDDLQAKNILVVESNVYFIDFGCSTMDETQGSLNEELSYFREHMLRL
jgi:tRNA A-37 threonylcarbamoyl transferase component Bud32